MDRPAVLRGIGNPSWDGVTIGPDALFAAKSTDRRRFSWVVLYPTRIEQTKFKKLTTLFDKQQNMTTIPVRDISTVSLKKDGFGSKQVTVRVGAEDITFRFANDHAAEFQDLLTALTSS